MIVLFFGIVLISSSVIQVTLAQTKPSSKYENPQLGISFQYPSKWDLTDNRPTTTEPLLNTMITFLDPGLKIYLINIQLTKLDDPINGCSCKVLKDYVAWDYDRSFKNPKFIYDNQTIIGKHIPAWEMLIDSTGGAPVIRQYVVWAIYENYGYELRYAAGADDQFDRYLDGFKKILNTVAFTHVEPPKKPSFLSSKNNVSNSSSNSSLTTSINEKIVKVVSSNNFIDSIGVLHVVGEVQNNLGQPIKFVKVVSTFYDSNNQVVATDFTYTNPADIPIDGEAPFDLSLSSASIPVQNIDHYKIVTEYNY